MTRKNLVWLLLCIATLTASAQVPRPKLVVGVVVDQMRWDYLYYYQNEYGEGGLKRVINEGFSCENTMINYAPTVTAIGHASVYTGTVPALHGIAGNYFYQDDAGVYCCGDNQVAGVGSNSPEGKMSPHRMLATTIGDQLKIATDFRSKVIGVALKDRASILPAGHSADGAYWWDTSAGQFITSTFYMDKLPDWVTAFNKTHRQKPGTNVKTANIGVTLTFQMAEAALINEQLGKHADTDMLTVSVSSTDAIGHEYGTRGKENHDVYMQLDKDLTTFLNALDREVGKGNYLLFLTADHGAAHNYNLMKNHRIPAGAWNYKKATAELNKYLESRFGIAPVMGEDNYQFYFNDSTIQAKGLEKKKVVGDAIKWLKQNTKEYLYIVDNENLANETMPSMLKERLTNGYNRQRSGEITVVTRPGFFGATDSPNYRGTMHGQPYPYDAHIPLVFMGWNIKHGATALPTRIVDIAPTVCQMLHIQQPNACVGNAILPVAEQ